MYSCGEGPLLDCSCTVVVKDHCKTVHVQLWTTVRLFIYSYVLISSLVSRCRFTYFTVDSYVNRVPWWQTAWIACLHKNKKFYCNFRLTNWFLMRRLKCETNNKELKVITKTHNVYRAYYR